MYFDDTGKYFSGMDGCWAILEQSIKWQDISPSASKVKVHEEAEIPKTYESPEAEITPSGGGSDSVSSPRKRPLGTKLAKRNKAKSKVEEVHNARHLDLLEALNKTMVDNQARKIELEERRTISLERQTTENGQVLSQ